MTRKHAGLFTGLLTLILGAGVISPGASATSAQAPGYRYQYISLDDAALPPGIDFFDPAALTNGGRIYGTAVEIGPDDVYTLYVAYYQDGKVTVLQPGWALAVNQAGMVGGSVQFDPDEFIDQAAIFHGDRVKLIPRLPGEYASYVDQITDSGLAMVVSLDEDWQVTRYLYNTNNGRVTPVPYGRINNRGTIAGTTGTFDLGYRAFRYDPHTDKRTLFDPLPGDENTWGLGINNSGDVLGYSFIFNGRERIGVWDQRGRFQTYFVQGTPQFPTLSNRLLFNDNNLIVITLSYSDWTSYIVPKPGVRLNLADIVEDAPQEFGALFYIQDVNNRGDMIGFGSQGSFYLRRLGSE